MFRLASLATLLLALPAHAFVTIDWVTVGDPGNACETQGLDCEGGVSYPYRIGKYEVTNAQYAAFLNAVAATDANGLYSTNMGSASSPFFGGITRSGSSGSYTYSTISGREDMPVNHVNWFDSLRFANWLHNGQPTGLQDNTTTEDGAYPFSGTTSVGTRNAGAVAFLTSEDEWYKAAYYDAGSASYFDYPAGSDTQTSCATPGTTANTANCGAVVGDVVDAGSYTGAPSPYGTFDQGGNVFEWTEEFAGIPARFLRGGSWGFGPLFLAASTPLGTAETNESASYGFRVATLAPAVPSVGPAGLLVLAAGLLALAAGLLGAFGYHRRRL